MNISVRLSIAILVCVVAFPVVASTANSRCTEGAAEPMDPRFAKTLRPTRTAQCRYGFEELVRRMTRLSLDKEVPYSVEAVEKTFAIPEMTTTYDDPRLADYSMTLSGEGGWTLYVEVREAFYPLDKGAPGFVPGLRPKRLRRIEDASLRIDLTIHASPGTSGAARCIPVSSLLEALSDEGWEDVSSRYPAPTDGGVSYPTLGYGEKVISLQAQRGACARNFVLMQDRIEHAQDGSAGQ
jgi:hypothetical protein